VNSIVRCPRTGRACSEGACRERHWCRQLFERGLSHRGLPLKRKFRPRCCAKTRAGAPCSMRVVPGKRRCRFHGGLSTGPKTKAGRARIAEVQRRRWNRPPTPAGERRQSRAGKPPPRERATGHNFACGRKIYVGKAQNEQHHVRPKEDVGSAFLRSSPIHTADASRRFSIMCCAP
jgi:hypothetical protein